jgi:hypothetical protein
MCNFGFWIENLRFPPIGNPKSKIALGLWQKGVCTWLSTKTMTVRVRSAPPNSTNFSEEKIMIENNYTEDKAMKL